MPSLLPALALGLALLYPGHGSGLSAAGAEVRPAGTPWRTAGLGQVPRLPRPPLQHRLPRAPVHRPQRPASAPPLTSRCALLVASILGLAVPLHAVLRVPQTSWQGWAVCAAVGSNSEVRYMTDAEKTALLGAVRLFLIDIDGVLWRGTEVLPGAWATLRVLRKTGVPVVFVTNTSSVSRATLVKKFASLGYPEVQEADIWSASYAAAAYLSQIGFPTSRKVYVLGEVGIVEELGAAGYDCIADDVHSNAAADLSANYRMVHDVDVGAVVTGLDRRLTYSKLQYAFLCLRCNPDCLFIATNTDATGHLTADQEWAAGGCIAGAVAGCTRRDPIVVGKPSAFAMEYVSRQFGVQMGDICVIGDRLDSDVLFGKSHGAQTVLVMTGVTKERELPASDLQPDHVLRAFSDILPSTSQPLIGQTHC